MKKKKKTKKVVAIVKLGGRAITDKSTRETLDEAALEKCAILLRDAVTRKISSDSSSSTSFLSSADEKDDEGTPPLCEKYGVWQEKSMYGKKYMGVVRTTYLIAPGGKVLQRWDKVKVPGHAEEVLAAIQEAQNNG